MNLKKSISDTIVKDSTYSDTKNKPTLYIEAILISIISIVFLLSSF